jgi:hypothetical protein
MKRVALPDIDGTLCESIFANITHNDNSKFDEAFLERLRNVEPYPWVGAWDWEQYTITDIVTGRPERFYETTRDWLLTIFPRRISFPGLPFTVHHTQWDDSLPTREESYKKYVQQKTLKLLELIARYNYDGYHVDVFEDDKDILAHIGWHRYHPVSFTRYIVEDGVLHEMNLKYLLS